MTKKHYICTHTCSDPEARKTFIDNTTNITVREFFESIGTDKAKLLQHWMGKEDFFFCHWYAESEEDIIEALGEETNSLILTLPHEMPRYISSNNISDELVVNPDEEE